MLEVLEQHGSFEDSDDGKRRIYKAANPNHLILGVVDPINLCVPKQGFTKKDEIDAISAYAVSLRERCEASFVFLQQENRNSSGMDRRKAELTESSAEDLKDSGNTYNDCEICIAVYYPLRHRLKTCHDYPIIVDGEYEPGKFMGLRDKYRGLTLIKNRNGESEKYVSTNFFGEIGLFRELPKASEIHNYLPYTMLKYNEDEIVDVTPRQEFEKITFDF